MPRAGRCGRDRGGSGGSSDVAVRILVWAAAAAAAMTVVTVMSFVMVASHTCSLRGKVSKPGHVRAAVLLVVSAPVCPVMRATCDLPRACFLHCLRQHGSLSPGSCRCYAMAAEVLKCPCS